MTSAKPVILTPGDPAGIGPEITLKAHLQRPGGWAVLGDRRHLGQLADQLGLPVHLADWQPGEPLPEKALPVCPLDWPIVPKPGQPEPENSRAVIAAVDRAVQLVTTGLACALVTNPIHKSSLYQAGFTHQGHTDYLASLCGGDSVMMLANRHMRVVPATVHIPLAEVASQLTAERLEQILAITAAALTRDFGIAKPHIAVCGLNPHAGEDGHMGREEQEIIKPLLARLQHDSWQLSGPLAADTLFHPEAVSRYDAIIGTYHDQVLIPIKTVDFHNTVNVTLGLPIIRTSPDHGTGFDIAGQGQARPDSLIAAIDLAIKMAGRRFR